MNVWKRGPNQWQLTWDEGRDDRSRRVRRRETVHGPKKAAEARWRQVQHEIETGTATIPTDMTVGEWMTYWLTHIKVDLRPSTRASYQALIDRHIQPTMGRILVARLTVAQVQQAVARWRATKNRHRSGAVLSPRRVRYCLGILRQALDYATKQQVVQRNVAKLVDMPKSDPAEAAWWDMAEAETFLTRTRHFRYWIAWMLALTTGLRQGEILGLQ